MPSGLTEILKSAKGALLSPWNQDSLAELAHTNMPDLPVRSAWLLEADVRAVWLRWVIEGTVPIGSSSRNAASLVAALLGSAEAMLGDVAPLLNIPERGTAARLMAEIAYAWITAQGKKRIALTTNERRLVLLDAGDPAKCWICGEPFSTLALSRFLGESLDPFTESPYVDCFYPRGMRAGDFECQVEHVMPVAAGGTNLPENLRLACGYCNRVKHESLDIYARSSGYVSINHPSLGPLELPNPYWVCRIMAVDGQCSVCGSSSRECVLRAASSRRARYINPSNLQLYCGEHDPISTERWIPARLFQKGVKTSVSGD